MTTIIEESVQGILRESYFLFGKMAPYLLFGFFIAGILHVFIKADMITKYLGGNNASSVIKASLFGIPLPLCSCSVIPAAMSLRREGASRGAVLSFLISTPTTGVDSMLATYSLMGGFFTVYRIIAAFVTGVLSGLLSNFLIKEKNPRPAEEKDTCKFCGSREEHDHSISSKIRGVFNYAFRDLLKDSGAALIIGIVIGGGIAYFMPASFIETYMGSGLKAMVIMLLIGIPMYVCATASIPIAAALMMKGMDPGAAVVFLIAGPATNIVTMAVVAKSMGSRTLLVYLFSIVAGSMTLGMVFGPIYRYFYGGKAVLLMPVHQHEAFFGWVGNASGIVLLVLIVYNVIRTKKSAKLLS